MHTLNIAPEFLDVSKLQIIECFVFYSILGWLVESIYMSICEKKLTNRGFGFGPFCPIYGFGATIGAVVLSPFRFSYIILYVVSALIATTFEFLVGRAMQFFLGDFWWDYTMKPFNYKGIICLESTLAWGVYGIVVVKWLHPFVLYKTAVIPLRPARIICLLILGAYLIDFIYHVLLALHIDLQETITERGMQAAVLAKEKTSNAIHKVEEKRDLAIEIFHEKKDMVSGSVTRKRQAVLDWYREHRWR